MRSFSLAAYEERVPIRIGSLSQCFSARHAGVEVLLKQLLPAFARVPSIASAWLQCAEENSRFDHPGCLQVLDWGDALGESYLSLPALPALSVRELLAAAAKSGVWPSAQAVVSIATDALIALAYVHGGFELAHLDLDPHALLLRKDGSVLLTEFGMWRALPAEAATRERFDRGRVAYLSPELTKSLPGDVRSDIFSLGAVLYELLGKQRPFQGATQLVTAMAIAEGRRRPLRELAPEAPELRDVRR
jgi:serine/threonine-protein kinase